MRQGKIGLFKMQGALNGKSAGWQGRVGLSKVQRGCRGQGMAKVQGQGKAGLAFLFGAE